MTCAWIINVLLTLLVSVSSDDLVCSPNEIPDKCPYECPFDSCPKTRLSDRTPCKKPLVCPPPTCKCSFNYRRADNGTCIPTTECPSFECPENEVYDACPSYCPSDDCSDAPLKGICPFLLLFVVNCSPTCKCVENFYRNDGICVPFKECPQIGDQTETTEQPLK